MKKAKAWAKKACKIIGAAVLALLALVAVVNVALAVQKYSRPNTLPSVFGISPLIVLSGSMEPDIRLDDLVFIRKVNPERLKKGDIITFMQEDSTHALTHRIVGIQRTPGGELAFATKGDRNNANDAAPAYGDQVLGLYFARIPKVGRLVNLFLLRPQGIAICVAAPLVLFLIVDMLRRFLRREETTESEEAQELARLRALVADCEQNEDTPAD